MRTFINVLLLWTLGISKQLDRGMLLHDPPFVDVLILLMSYAELFFLLKLRAAFNGCSLYGVVAVAVFWYILYCIQSYQII